MAQASLFTKPMARKKQVAVKYEPNSYRVISQQAESTPFPREHRTLGDIPGFNIIGQPNGKATDHRYNRPNENNVGFLRQDVRLLNEPLCNVYTASTHGEQHGWWPSRTSEEPLHQAPHTLDTTVRHDFQYRGSELKGSFRHTANPNKQPVRGTVPVNFLRGPSGQQRLWQEGISYEHQYNSRVDPNYPIRSKRHGGFVWDAISQPEVDRLLNEHGLKPLPPVPSSASLTCQGEAAKTASRPAPSTTDVKTTPTETPVLPPTTTTVETTPPEALPNRYTYTNVKTTPPETITVKAPPVLPPVTS